MSASLHALAQKEKISRMPEKQIPLPVSRFPLQRNAEDAEWQSGCLTRVGTSSSLWPLHYNFLFKGISGK